MGVEERRILILAAPVFDEELKVAAVNALRHMRFLVGEDGFRDCEESFSWRGGFVNVYMYRLRINVNGEGNG
jgi:hypothetical protein